MRGDCGIDEGFSNRFQPREGTLLVITHEAAIPGDIGRQDRR
jgi:hypothetical protein